ncbi:phycobilisome rod-core linker polypeptide [Nodosilinea sp. LEGE 07088]|uniref:phycobilisome rod-core linker polypeptide n=1 Tax=Nodosilinea sp. LEGE 07088 TaxID=2777968 RepID=UPI0018812787|nr:phycobilisome rod-core linker polypeptide [Nodosilinea sp. LEGE 07088]MBE9136267.1 phycobilisome rod-core linker polypeptide [Nodosilinea sp. LEGE 07088]
MTSTDEFAVREITVDRQSPAAERQAALVQIYAQVLERQPYAFERKQLAEIEADFLRKKSGVKRFLRDLGHSEVYLNEFYYNSSNPKFIELCFKHFIGRAPSNPVEMRRYCDILMRNGVKAMITALLDSEDYRRHFGCFTVPHAWAEDSYPSPRTFWETEVLLHELHGRRGWTLPTMTWHNLHLDCEGGICHLPESHLPESYLPERTPASGQPAATNLGLDALHQVLSTMEPQDLEKFAATLSGAERDKLRHLLLPTP